MRFRERLGGFLWPTLITLTLTAASLAQESRRQTVQVATGSAAVVSASSHATKVGITVMKDGGNAVDAAVSVAMALAVTWPEAGNLGGGGFMMVLPKPDGDRQHPICIDYREKAPAAAHRTMFRRDDSKHSWKIVGVPGTVRGLHLAHQKFGHLPWKRLVQPAERLAREGFAVDAFLAISLNSVLHQVAGAGNDFAPLRNAYGCPHPRPWQTGDRLKLPALANTLGAIADNPNAIYEGDLAKQLAEAMKAGDGLITTDDLAKYEAKVREPIHGKFRGYDVWGPPPPSSGGTCLIEALNMLEQLPLDRQNVYSAINVHLRTEVMKRVFRDRARHLGDADFVSIPAKLTSKAYARKLAKRIPEDRATPSEQLAGDITLADESDHTTHFSVVDADGMAVSNTYTLEASWGSRRMVPELGYVLNNEMGDFNWLPGYTDRHGRIGTTPNQIEPNKRMLSSQTPTLITRDGKLAFAIGSPGGRTIINTVLGIALDVLEHERPLEVAVAAPRMHHSWLPDRLYFEGADREEFADLVRQLREMGHEVVARRQGSAHCIEMRDGVARAVADYRRGGAAEAIPTTKQPNN